MNFCDMLTRSFYLPELLEPGFEAQTNLPLSNPSLSAYPAETDFPLLCVNTVLEKARHIFNCWRVYANGSDFVAGGFDELLNIKERLDSGEATANIAASLGISTDSVHYACNFINRIYQLAESEVYGNELPLVEGKMQRVVLISRKLSQVPQLLKNLTQTDPIFAKYLEVNPHFGKYLLQLGEGGSPEGIFRESGVILPNSRLQNIRYAYVAALTGQEAKIGHKAHSSDLELLVLGKFAAEAFFNTEGLAHFCRGSMRVLEMRNVENLQLTYLRRFLEQLLVLKVMNLHAHKGLAYNRELLPYELCGTGISPDIIGSSADILRIRPDDLSIKTYLREFLEKETWPQELVFLAREYVSRGHLDQTIGRIMAYKKQRERLGQNSVFKGSEKYLRMVLNTGMRFLSSALMFTGKGSVHFLDDEKFLMYFTPRRQTQCNYLFDKVAEAAAKQTKADAK